MRTYFSQTHIIRSPIRFIFILLLYSILHDIISAPWWIICIGTYPLANSYRKNDISPVEIPQYVFTYIYTLNNTHTIGTYLHFVKYALWTQWTDILLYNLKGTYMLSGFRCDSICFSYVPTNSFFSTWIISCYRCLIKSLRERIKVSTVNVRIIEFSKYEWRIYKWVTQAGIE